MFSWGFLRFFMLMEMVQSVACLLYPNFFHISIFVFTRTQKKAQSYESVKLIALFSKRQTNGVTLCSAHSRCHSEQAGLQSARRREESLCREARCLGFRAVFRSFA